VRFCDTTQHLTSLCAGDSGTEHTGAPGGPGKLAQLLVVTTGTSQATEDHQDTSQTAVPGIKIGLRQACFKVATDRACQKPTAHQLSAGACLLRQILIKMVETGQTYNKYNNQQNRMPTRPTS
jgi:hypothetical protein